MAARGAVVAGLVAAVLVCAWRAAPAQPNGSESDESLSRLGRRVNTFLVSIAKDELDEQFDALLERSPLKKDRKKIDQLLESIKRETQKYGSFREVEQVKLERRGQSMVRAVYLYKCQEYPLVWDFVFYRSTADEEWTLISLRFHLDYDTL